MKIIILRVMFAVAAVLAAMGFDVSASRAGIYGNQPWCAVVDQGASNIMWECEYASVEGCMPYVLGGNRGTCQHNPYWQPEPPPPISHHRHHRHHVKD